MKTDETVEEPAAPETYQVGDFTIELAPPEDYSLRQDVKSAMAYNSDRACAAALLICWKGKGRPDVSPKRHRYDALEYGGAVFDELARRRKVPVKQILDAGFAAWKLATRDLLEASEVAAIEGFSGAPEDDSTGS